MIEIEIAVDMTVAVETSFSLADSEEEILGTAEEMAGAMVEEAAETDP